MQTVELAVGIDVLFAPISEFADIPPDPVEQNSLGPDAVKKRQREFHAGRALAREALRRADVAPVPIPIGSNRLPKWPLGVRASISHTNTHVAVAIAMSSEITTIGVDIEAIEAVSSDLAAQILSEDELIMNSGENRPLIEYFSAKEAAYKSCYPVWEEYFDMSDVAIEFYQDHHFRCRPLVSLRSNDVIEHGTGYLCSLDDHIISLFCTGAD